MNCYFISIFACCREIFDALIHTGCITADSLADAMQKLETAKQENEKKKELELSPEE